MQQRMISKAKSLVSSAVFPIALVIFDIILSAFIVHRIPYTEIDWRAYMQEVEGVIVDGNYNYTELKGDTGPLVYPAGFVYMFAGLRSISDGGTNIQRMQVLFACIHVYVVAVVLWLCRKASSEPSKGSNGTNMKIAGISWWLLPLIISSRRGHSIFILRLFNDAVAMAVLYTCLGFLATKRWTAGCTLFSLAVSVKMNILLFAPALGVHLLRACGLWALIKLVCLCVGIQVILAIPFLLVDPYAYVKNAFELGRVFQFKWTVNFRFLPESVFVSKELALLLLACTVLCWLAFGHRRWSKSEGGLLRMFSTAVISPFSPCAPGGVTRDELLSSMFESNLIGIVFARSIHYQFYCWYSHSLPFLLWKSALPWWLQLTVFVAIEWTYNVFPSTVVSSLVLQGAHVLLLVALWVGKWPVQVSDKSKPLKVE